MAVSEAINKKIMLMVKEPQADGTVRYKRIPWDLITIDGVTGLSPIPFSPFGEPGNSVVATPGTDVLSINDMFYDENRHDDNDDIYDIQYFDSEKQFLEIHCENTTSYYTGDTTQSIEAGYPRT